jgi:hypothetical protein
MKSGFFTFFSGPPLTIIGVKQEPEDNKKTNDTDFEPNDELSPICRNTEAMPDFSLKTDSDDDEMKKVCSGRTKRSGGSRDAVSKISIGTERKTRGDSAAEERKFDVSKGGAASGRGGAAEDEDDEDDHRADRDSHNSEVTGSEVRAEDGSRAELEATKKVFEGASGRPKFSRESQIEGASGRTFSTGNIQRMNLAERLYVGETLKEERTLTDKAMELKKSLSNFRFQWRQRRRRRRQALAKARLELAGRGDLVFKRMSEDRREAESASLIEEQIRQLREGQETATNERHLIEGLVRLVLWKMENGEEADETEPKERRGEEVRARVWDRRRGQAKPREARVNQWGRSYKQGASEAEANRESDGRSERSGRCEFG